MSQLTFHVAPQGKAAATGSANHPFGTLEAARDALRAYRAQHGLPTGGARIILQGGDYWREQTLELDQRDGGEPGSPVVWQAAPGARPRLLGGRRLHTTTPVTDPAILERLSPPARAAVRQIDLRAHGILNPGQLRSRGFSRAKVPAHLELFLDGQPLTLARWPNDDYLTIAAPATVDPTGDGHGGQLGKLPDGYHYREDRPRAWRDTSDIWVHGYWAYDWANSYERVATFDHDHHLLTTDLPHGLYGFRTGQRFYFLNVLEELDTPGEYWVDTKRGLAYYWPLTALGDGELLGSLLESPMITMTQVAHLQLSGLTMEATRGDGIVVSEGDAVEILGCTLRSIGGNGVTLNEGMNHRIADCDMTQLGDNAISLVGGCRTTLTPCNFTVHNNHLWQFGRWSRTYVCGVLMRTVGARITNNLIHDAPHTGILYQGNENLIAGNELHSLTLETGDCGSIYTGRDYTARGNLLRGNYIHHSGGLGMGSMGIYWDDCVSGQRAVGNIFQHLHWAVFMGGGRELEAVSNLFLDCAPGLHLDARGISPAEVWQNMVNKTMYDRLLDVQWQQPPYSTRYPALAQLVPYYQHYLTPGTAKGPGVPPANNLAASNLIVGGEWADIGWGAVDGAHITQRDNLQVVTDTVLAAAGRGDFRPLPTATLPPGYTPPDICTMGLQHGPQRTAVARVHSHLQVTGRSPIADSADQRLELTLTLHNLGDLPVAGQLVARIIAPAPVTWLGPLPKVAVAAGAVQVIHCALRTPPQRWRLELAGTHPGQRPARLDFDAHWHLASLATELTLENLAASLTVQPSVAVKQGDTVLADLHVLGTPSHLAVLARVHDRQPTLPANFWEGSCVEIFAAAKRGATVRQLICLPPVAAAPAKLSLYEAGKPLAATHATAQYQPITGGGYTLALLIPWTDLGLPAGCRALALEFAIGIAQDSHGQQRYATLHGNGHAYLKSGGFVVAELSG